MNNPLISILMPVKNAGLFLDECLNSILEQSYSKWELIAVNDNSTDNSLNLLNIHAKKDKRIKVLKNKGKGIIDALRSAYKQSQGEFISRMDADDLMAVDKLKVLKNNIPGGNLPFVQLAANHLIFHDWSEQLNPGYLRRMKKRLEKNAGQQMYLPTAKIIGN